MNKFTIPVLLSIIMLLGISTVYADEDELIPSWIKIIAFAWYNGDATDTEYIDAMEFLIGNRIININGTDYDELEDEALEWQIKYEEAEAQRVAQSQSDAAQHKILYDEADTKYETLKTVYDVKYAEWQQTYNEMSEEIDDLKKQLDEK